MSLTSELITLEHNGGACCVCSFGFLWLVVSMLDSASSCMYLMGDKNVERHEQGSLNLNRTYLIVDTTTGKLRS